MFVSQERNSNKKRFQKPNILRRKPKAAMKLSENLNVDSYVSPNTQSDVGNTSLRGSIIDDLQLENITKYVKPFQTVDKESIQSLNFDSNVLYGQLDKEIIDPKHSSNQDVDNESSLLVNIVNYSEESPVQSSVNVESFFNNGEDRENVMLFTIDPNKEMQSLVIIGDESHKHSIYGEQNDDLITSMVPMSAVTAPSNKTQAQEQTSTVVPPQQLFEQISFGPNKFKCDVPDCNKEFRSEQKWKRHKNVHNKDGSIRLPRQVTSECPVKKVNADGTEQRCGKIYLVREQLVKHLNEDHTIEDAAYRCEQCGRQFFWASGLRVHTRSHVPRVRAAASLACGWPGCGRVFALPCRLREHARAHTGDKPYPCRFPNCGATFRSASKLERHARRHTGLRRHACGTCGRAFLRREHLRDHAARHHAARAAAHRTPGEDCEQMFEDPAALQEQMISAHVTEDSAPGADAETDADADAYRNSLDYIFLAVEDETERDDEPEQMDMKGSSVDLEEAAQSGAEADGAALDSRAARTHCPWPLAARLQPAHADLVLDDDAAVEQGEGSESNIYTVRSDLFLHGNVLINEDSVQMGSAVESAESAVEASVTHGDELGLGLLEHAHIDLMQEEMMFTVWQ